MSRIEQRSWRELCSKIENEDEKDAWIPIESRFMEEDNGEEEEEEEGVEIGEGEIGEDRESLSDPNLDANSNLHPDPNPGDAPNPDDPSNPDDLPNPDDPNPDHDDPNPDANPDPNPDPNLDPNDDPNRLNDEANQNVVDLVSRPQNETSPNQSSGFLVPNAVSNGVSNEVSNNVSNGNFNAIPTPSFASLPNRSLSVDTVDSSVDPNLGRAVCSSTSEVSMSHLSASAPVVDSAPILRRLISAPPSAPPGHYSGTVAGYPRLTPPRLINPPCVLDERQLHTPPLLQNIDEEDGSGTASRPDFLPSKSKIALGLAQVDACLPLILEKRRMLVDKIPKTFFTGRKKCTVIMTGDMPFLVAKNHLNNVDMGHIVSIIHIHDQSEVEDLFLDEIRDLRGAFDHYTLKFQRCNLMDGPQIFFPLMLKFVYHFFKGNDISVLLRQVSEWNTKDATDFMKKIV